MEDFLSLIQRLKARERPIIEPEVQKLSADKQRELKCGSELPFKLRFEITELILLPSTDNRFSGCTLHACNRVQSLKFRNRGPG
jgi:hypothetical protein